MRMVLPSVGLRPGALRPRSCVPGRASALALALTALAFSGLAGQAHAQAWRWEDSAGGVHYADELGEIPARYRGQAKKVRELPVPEAKDDAAAPAAGMQPPPGLPVPGAPIPPNPYSALPNVLPGQLSGQLGGAGLGQLGIPVETLPGLATAPGGPGAKPVIPPDLDNPNLFGAATAAAQAQAQAQASAATAAPANAPVPSSLGLVFRDLATGISLSPPEGWVHSIPPQREMTAYFVGTAAPGLPPPTLAIVILNAQPDVPTASVLRATIASYVTQAGYVLVEQTALPPHARLERTRLRFSRPPEGPGSDGAAQLATELVQYYHRSPRQLVIVQFQFPKDRLSDYLTLSEKVAASLNWDPPAGTAIGPVPTGEPGLAPARLPAPAGVVLLKSAIVFATAVALWAIARAIRATLRAKEIPTS
jgi:hypothetical protein